MGSATSQAALRPVPHLEALDLKAVVDPENRVKLIARDLVEHD